MKLLFVIDSFFTGGAEYSTLALIQYVKSQGISIRVCILKETTPQYDYRLFGIDSTEVVVVSAHGFWHQRKLLKMQLIDFKPQLVHSVLFQSNLLVRSIRVCDASFVHLESLVNLTYSKERLSDPRVNRFKLELHRWFNSFTARLGTDHYHPNGAEVKAHFQKKLGISPHKMTMVPRGRNGKIYEVTPYLKSALQLDSGKKVLINVGRQDFQKGHDLLLNAVALLPPHIQTTIAVVIVGREGNATPHLQQLTSDLKLDHIVHFLGHRTDVPALLKMADVFVFPSRYEGLPGALIEAEAAGLPIICSHLPMMLEVVEPGQNALTFDLHHVEALTKAITTLVADDELRTTFAARSRIIFQEKFQIEHVHQQMMALYQKLVHGH